MTDEPPPAEEPLLPAEYDEADLRDAVGIGPSHSSHSSHSTPSASEAVPLEVGPRGTADLADVSRRLKPLHAEAEVEAHANADRERDSAGAGDDDDDDVGEPKSRKTMVVAATTLVAGISIATLLFLGHANSQRYVIACESDQVIAEVGRSFPPWGTHSLGGAEWKPIKIPPEAECKERETEDDSELARWYLGMLVDRASSLLTAREVTKVDEAAALLEQALLLARAPERRDERKEIERLRGDVGYWRASARLRDAATALSDAANQFDAAAAQRPRHASDASARATYVRKLADELRAGSAGASVPSIPSAEHPTAPVGVALPVEPARGSGAEPAAPMSAPIDAGLPTGGVLL